MTRNVRGTQTRLSLPVTVAAAAVLVLLSGTGGAVAGTMITGKQIKNNTITTKDIKNKTLTTQDLNSHAVAGLRGQSGASGYEVAHGAKTVSDFTRAVVSASCPVGKVVTGGTAHWHLEGPQYSGGSAYPIALYSDESDPEGTWVADAVNQYDISNVLYIDLICVTAN